MDLPIQFDQTRLREFCDKWEVSEVALFGSVLRKDFGPDSDVDVLVSFRPGAHPTMFTLVRMIRDLEAIFGRRVDMIDRRAVERSENYIRRHEVLRTARVIHAA